MQDVSLHLAAARSALEEERKALERVRGKSEFPEAWTRHIDRIDHALDEIEAIEEGL